MSKSRFKTDRQVAAFSPLPGQKRTDYYHAAENGFICRVSTSSKTWMVSHTVEVKGIKKRRKATIGHYPDVTLADALVRAREIKSDGRSKGVDLVGVAEARKTAPTMSDLFDHYFDIYVTKRRKAVSSIKEDKRQWETLKDKIGDLKAQDITRKDLIDLHSTITKKGSPIMANRTLTLISTVFNAALDAEMVINTPCTRLKSIMNVETNRERFLSDDEIKTLWEAMDNEAANMRDILRLILLTAQRPGEIAAMEVSEIDQGTRIWTIPGGKAKNKQAHQVPLSEQGWAIIEPRLGNEQWIFQSNYGRGGKGKTHTKSTKDVRRRLMVATGINGWTAHDLRRTARTIMAREKVPPHIAERVINHKLGRMEAVYDQHGYTNEKAAALNKLAHAIGRIIGVENKKAKVIKIRRIA